ncbi:MAG: tRNA epoxyqueuosine(34) reductase QueG [Gemmatimonadota bacterium]|nr:MAG: tRNA epoxyqueuosine(34) reductase QueG [Gemmatimonadota bacterium]
MAPTRLPAGPRITPSEAVKRRARALGFDLVGIAPAERPAHADFYIEWLRRGYGGEMHYMARPDAVRRRLEPVETLPGARSIIVVALNYHLPDDGLPAGPERGIVARYALGNDYHRIFEEKLGRLADALAELVGHEVNARAYVDYGPVLERGHAQRAGLGWIGKNTMLIHPRIGSFLFLGEILTDAALQPDAPFLPDHWGTCERCIEACPTGAITSARQLDARLCISYLTIELRGPIPRPLRPLIGSRIFGCDICQDVCPWNDAIPRSGELGFTPREAVIGPRLVELMYLSEEDFHHRFQGTALTRCKRRGLLRNVAVAIGNWADPSALPALIRGLHDEEPLVRGHCAWALGKIPSPAAGSSLQERRTLETDAWVNEEIELALAELAVTPT